MEDVTRYPCTACQRRTPRDELTVKRVSFFKFGERGKLLRVRTVAWLCPDCKLSDVDWNRPRGGGAPIPPKKVPNG